MYTEQQLHDQMETVDYAQATVILATEQLLSAQTDLIEKQNRLLRMFEQNEKEELGIAYLGLSSLYVQAIEKTLSKYGENAKKSRTIYLLNCITSDVKKKYNNLVSDELVALRILTSKTADEALNENATLDSRDLYDVVRQSLLDVIFDMAGTDLSELAD